jgi:hypothetical protein
VRWAGVSPFQPSAQTAGDEIPPCGIPEACNPPRYKRNEVT